MALTVLGVNNKLSPDIVPKTHTLPEYVQVPSAWDYRYDLVIPMNVSSGGANVNQTMILINEFLIAQVGTIVSADFDTDNDTVTAWGDWTDISTRHTPTNNDTSMQYLLSATVNQYLLSATIYVNSR
jgi:hypothetical protein